MWQTDKLCAPPRAVRASAFDAAEVQAFFLDGLPWKGRATRIFAYVGLPPRADEQSAPGIVLVHGGGGTAFADWVRLWTGRGYAAIAMDTCGCTAGGDHAGRPRHGDGGPPGWGGFDQIEEPVEDQWMYHAVADVILAHSLLRSLPQVDPGRIGITGISWGGIVACIVAGVDPRFRFMVPVYGCGFLGDNSAWLPQFRDMGRAKAARWLELWDPSHYLGRVHCPALWVTGTNDFAFPMDSLQKSYRLPPGERNLCVRVRMPHGHGGPGENPEEVRVFADSVVLGGPPLARAVSQGCDGRRAWATFSGPTPALGYEFNYTSGTGLWEQREWRTVEAAGDLSADRTETTLPADATVYYFNRVGDRGLASSSEHEEIAGA